MQAKKYCSECERETDHEVSIETVSESDHGGLRGEYGKQPYHRRECLVCGEVRTERTQSSDAGSRGGA